MQKRQLTCIGTIIAILGAATTIFVQGNYPHKPVKENVKFAFNEGFPTFTTETIRLLSFGYPFAVSSLLWIRFLIHTPPESMGKAEVSWIYLDLKAISDIDVNFVPVFSHGAMYLSVITEDKMGAKLLLERGVERYPNFWRFRAYLAYHYQYELHDLAKAAEQYAIAARLPGAPAFMGALAGQLFAKAGDTNLAMQTLESMLDTTTDPAVRKRIEDKIVRLRSGGAL